MSANQPLTNKKHNFFVQMEHYWGSKEIIGVSVSIVNAQSRTASRKALAPHVCVTTHAVFNTDIECFSHIVKPQSVATSRVEKVKINVRMAF